MWDKCGMSRNEKDLKSAIKKKFKLRKDFEKCNNIPGDKNSFNESLYKAGRLADFLNLENYLLWMH